MLDAGADLLVLRPVFGLPVGELTTAWPTVRHDQVRTLAQRRHSSYGRTKRSRIAVLTI